MNDTEALFRQVGDGSISAAAALARLREARSGGNSPVTFPAQALSTANTGGETRDFTLSYFTRKVAHALSVRPEDVDPDAELMDLGIDSTNLLQMADEVEAELSITLYPTVFFEHTTLTAVAAFFAEEHRAAFEALEKGSPNALGTSERIGAKIPSKRDVAVSVHPPSESRAIPIAPEGPGSSETDVAAFSLDYFTRKLARALSVRPEDIDPDSELMDLGMESATLLQMADELETELSITLYPTVFFEHTTLTAVADHFASEHAVALARLMSAGDERPAVPARARAGTDSEKVLPAHEPRLDTISAERRAATPHDTALYVVEERAIDSPPAVSPGSALWIVPDGLSLPTDGTGLLSGSPECAEALGRARADATIAVNIILDSRVILRDDLHERLSSAMTDLSTIVSSLGSGATNAITLGVLGAEGHGSTLSYATSAFLKSACHEYSRLHVTQLDLPSSVDDGATIADAITRARGVGGGTFAHARFDGQLWSARTAVPADLEPKVASLRDGAVVIITGGTGALGQLFAAHLVRRCRARVVLTGRRTEFELPPALSDADGAVRYEPCDVANRDSVRDLLERVSARYGRIDGIVHSAGTIDDSPILRKTAESRRAVTAPKVDGVLHLDELTGRLPLDFFVCFSSIAGFTGNKGQSDYSAANGFMDGFMAQRESLRRRGLRSGRSLSINWPLWEEGGMKPPAIVRELMEERLGLRPMASDVGLEVFDRVLASEPSQVAVFCGDVQRIDAWVTASAPPVSTPSACPSRNDSPTSEQAATVPRPQVRTRATRPSTSTPASALASDLRDTEAKGRLPSSPGLIAVVGVDGVFPQSPDLGVFWSNIAAGRDLISNRLERWTFDGYLDLTFESMAAVLPSVEAGYIDDCVGFDHAFFNISHKEASLMDPQQRLALTSAWRAIENAGYDPESLRGERVGVFAGSSTHDFQTRYGALAKNIPADSLFGAHLATGLASNNIANRISYVLDVTGPSELVDTACSSSLVALNRATDAIRLGHCDSALVVGVNVILEGSVFAAFKATGLLSDQHRCKSFGKDGVGYVRSEGVGAVLIKPLARAEADRDDVRAIIRSVKVNHGGRVQSLTAPNPKQQAAVVRDAMLEADVPPASISYIEAHGTGTALGDSVEVMGLKSAFSQVQTLRKNTSDLPVDSIRIGSVKSNMGHLEAAAGIAGLIKVVLCLRNGVLPASIHSEEENPYLDLEGSPFVVNHETIPWRRPVAEDGQEYPLRAGVSSFGFGGTNGHVIVEEALPSPAPQPASAGPVCVPLSAPGSEQLDLAAEQLLAFLRDETERGRVPRLTDIAFTLQNGRAARAVRVCFIVDDLPHLLDALQAFRDGRDLKEIKTGDQPVGRPLKKALSNGAMRVLTDHYMRTGDVDGLGTLWAAGLPVVWSAVPGFEDARRVALPGHVFRDTVCWPVPVVEKAEGEAAPASGVGNNAVPAAESIAEPTARNQSTPVAPASVEDIMTYMSSAVAAKLGCAPATIDADTDLAEYGFDSILAVQLLDDLKRTFDIPLFVAELRDRHTIRELAAYIFGELRDGTPAPPVEHPGPIFLLSAPRSGSTLLRAMMMGHSGLFAPPELHLLGFETMGARAETIGGSGLGDGLVEAFAHLRSVSPDQARAEVAALERGDAPVIEVYSELQALCAPRILVDKSPTYGARIETLTRATDLFARPRFLHLVRRPEAVMTSFVANRFHRMLGAEQDQAWAVADQVWSATNRTIADFTAGLDADSVLRLHYEELVRRPEAACRRIGRWLGLPFAEEMLEPYSGDRLVHGLEPGSRSVGDPNFLDHEEIDACEATEWVASETDIPIDGEWARLAPELGYDTGTCFAVSHRSGKPATWTLSLRYEVENLSKVSRRDLAGAVDKLIRLYPILSSRWDPFSEQLVTEGTAKPIVSTAKARKRTVAALHAELDDWRDKHGNALGGEGEPPLAVHLLRYDERTFMQLLVNHHACDGASAQIVAEILLTLLQSFPVPPAVPTEGYVSLLSQRSGPPPRDADAPESLRPEVFALAARTSEPEAPLVEEVHRLEESLPNSLLVSPHLPDFLGAGLLIGLRRIEEVDAATILLRYHGRVDGGGTLHGAAVGNLAFDLAIGSRTSKLAHEEFAALRRAALAAMSTGCPDLDRNAGELSNVRLNFQDLVPIESGSVIARMVDAREVRSATVRTGAGFPLLDLIVRRSGESATLIVRHERGAFSNEQLARLRELWFESVSSMAGAGARPTAKDGAHR